MKPLAQQSWDFDNLPSIEDVGVYLAEARELLDNLRYMQKEFPKFIIKSVLTHADVLVSELEDAIGRLED